MLYPGQPLSPAEIDRFLEWSTPPTPEASQPNIDAQWFNNHVNEYEQQGMSTEEATEQARQEMARILNEPGLVSLIPHPKMGPIDFDAARCTFVRLHWSNDFNTIPSLTDKVIYELTITYPVAPVGLSNVTLTRCKIGHLTTTSLDRAELVLKDTKVRTFQPTNVVKRLVIDGGFIGSIALAGGTNPFGDVVIRRLSLARHRHGEYMQWLRDTRRRLAEKGNVPAASVFHGTELILDRQHDSFGTNLVSHLYEIGSDFGNSVSRPLWWVLIFFGIIAALAAGFDFVRLSNEVEWTKGLVGTACDQRVKRGVLLALQSILNPLNLFSAKPLVSAYDATWGAITTVLGMFGTISLGLFVLAVRRRFKLSGGSSD